MSFIEDQDYVLDGSMRDKSMAVILIQMLYQFTTSNQEKLEMFVEFFITCELA